jgi:anti-sigma factor RsiW
LSPGRNTHERSGAGFEEPQVSAALVSDYVAGRLDPLAAKYIEAAAQRDPELNQAIEHARAVRRRVKERLSGSRQ